MLLYTFSSPEISVAVPGERAPAPLLTAECTPVSPSRPASSGRRPAALYSFAGG